MSDEETREIQREAFKDVLRLRDAFVKGAGWYFRNRHDEPLYSESVNAALVEYPDESPSQPLSASVREEQPAKVVQIAAGRNAELTALCADGSLWRFHEDTQWSMEGQYRIHYWSKVPAISTHPKRIPAIPREDLN